MRRTFRVSLEMPGETTEDQMIRYIEIAVACWKGGMGPDDDLFYLDREQIVVSRMQAYRKNRDNTGRKIKI